MAIESAELARRATHVLGLLFTHVAALGLVAALAVRLGARRSDGAWRALLLVASVAVVARLATPVVAGLWLLYGIVFHAAVERLAGRALFWPVVGALLAAMVVAPVVWIGPLGDLGRHARELTAFATNVALLRCWGHAVDRQRGAIGPLRLDAFLLALFFFPTFANGPIEVPRQMVGGPGPDEPGLAAAGVRRVAGGVLKLAVIGLALPPAWTGVLATMTEAAAWRLWAVSALLYGWFFLAFSAWSDLAIGLAALAGRRVPENFRAPWRALDPADFWRRWHVSLGVWLRDYVYVPLGGNRRRYARNVAATFAVSAAWHVWGTLKLLGFGYYPVPAWSGFFLWGALNAAGVLAAARVRGRIPDAGGGAALARVATFLFASLCWLPFFLPASVPPAQMLRMVVRLVVPVW